MPVTQTKQSLLDAAIFLCGREFNNKDAVAETLIPLVFYEVARRYASDGVRRPLTLVTFSIAFINGAATLPVQVLTEFLQYGVLASAGDATLTPKWRYVSWLEFTRPLENTLGYFSVRADMGTSATSYIYVTMPGTSYTPGSGLTGTLTLTTPAAPTLPVASTDAITAPQEMQADLVLGLSRALSGQWMSAEVTA